MKERHVFHGSSRVQWASFDPESQIVQVKFLDGPLWNFYACERATWLRFIRAGSAGSYLRDVLERHRHGPA